MSVDDIEIDDIDTIIKKELGDDPYTSKLKIEDIMNFYDNFTRMKNIDFDKEMKNLTFDPNMKNTTFETDNQNTSETTNFKNLGEKILTNIITKKLISIGNKPRTRLDDLKNNVDGFQKITDLLGNKPLVSGRRTDMSTKMLESLLYEAKEAAKQEMANKSLNFTNTFMANNTLRSKESLRYYRWYQMALYFHYPRFLVRRLFFKVYEMIENMVYRAQFYVAFAQQMRYRYVEHPSYKMGFSFALLRQLLKEQKQLMNGAYYYYYNPPNKPGHTQAWSLYILEKMLHLERDMRDIQEHIKNMEYQTKMLIDPVYYEYMPSSTGRYSG